MAESIVRRRRLLLAAVILATLVPLFIARGAPASAATSPAAAKRSPAESVLVVRRAAGHDALWLLSPVDGTPTAAGDLPGFAGQVAVSPDGLSAAYLPENAAPRVWIGTGPLAPKTISLAGAGVKRAYSFTWLDDGRLLVSGVTKANADYYTSRLYLVNAATGKVRAFRGLSGIEPSAATAVGKVAYVKVTTVVPQTRYRGPVVRESLKLLSLGHPGGGRTVWSEQTRIEAAYRAFSQPQISSDGAWFLTGETGSDVRVTYAIRDHDGYPLLTLYTPALQAGAGWDASARRAAFAGSLPLPDSSEACVWVYDVVTGSLTRSAHGLLGDKMIERLAWSPAGALVAGAWVWDGSTSIRHVIALPGDLSTATDLGRGRLPVWVLQ
jgi:hypothetical protein